MVVRILDVVIDFLDQFLDAAKGSPAKSSLRDAIEPDLHLIQPRGIGWSEVYVEPWPCGEAASNSQMFVRGVIIHDDVHLQVLRDVLFNLPDKTQIFLVPVTRSTFREHFAVRRVQCGEQRGGSVASIILSLLHNPIPMAAAGYAPEPEFRSSHPRTKPLHFPGDLDTALQYPVLFLQKMDRSRA
jgi:hypothetical protein